jgi:hypothetical protein
VKTSGKSPQHQIYNAHGLSRISGLGCSHFARHYSGNNDCSLFLRVLRCFSSPRSPLLPMDSATDTPTLLGMGFPIQRSPDQSLFSGSPKLIAAYHVFHRLLAPRHPPYALSSLTINRLLLFNCQRATGLSKGSKPSVYLVEVNGLEPMTSCVQSRRSPKLSYTPKVVSDLRLRIPDINEVSFRNPNSKIRIHPGGPR